MDFRYFLKDQSRIDADDVIQYRREVFGDMVVSLAEAEGVFALNDEVADTCQQWDEFFVEVMTDYCVNQANPVGYVSEVNAEWLVSRISKDGEVKSDTELELLVRIIERAKSVPESLSAFALQQVAHAVVAGNGKLVRDESLTPGVIGQPEAKLIRRIMYGVGTEGRIAISRAEVEVLFDLNDKTIEEQNHPEWNDVFVKAVAAHLTMASGYQSLTREEVLRREAWLDDTTVDVAGMLSRTLSSFADLMQGSGWAKASQSDFESSQEAWGERNKHAELEGRRANPVEQPEAAWLAQRIGSDGVLHENEKALLCYLKEESDYIDPTLDSLFEKVA